MKNKFKDYILSLILTIAGLSIFIIGSILLFSYSDFLETISSYISFVSCSVLVFILAIIFMPKEQRTVKVIRDSSKAEETIKEFEELGYKVVDIKAIDIKSIFDNRVQIEFVKVK